MAKVYSSALIILCFLSITLLAFLNKKEIKRTGEYDLPILSTEVDVYFDNFGIPHISGQDLEDSYRVFGFIMAGERLFQMDMLRRVVTGRLSEVYGERTLDADILMRKLRFKKHAMEVIDNKDFSADPAPANIVKAFLEGVHYYIDNEPLPVEFDILGYTPDKFEAADLYAIAGYMSLTFAEGITGDVFITEMMEKLPEDKLSVLRIGADSDFNYIQDKKTVKTDFLETMLPGIEQIGDIVPLFQGSNSWVLAGHRTESGKPILANDPHIKFGSPHIFYEAHLKVAEFEVYGNYIPLLPFAVMGHTPYSAWGITMAEIDDLNIYQEKINPQNNEQVMFNNEWVELIKSTETIKVKNEEDIQVEVIQTPHGPVIDQTKYGLEGKLLSLSWSVYDKTNNIWQSFYEFPKARTVEQFKRAVSHTTAPGLNISWVNREGDIAWWVMGKFPKLPDGVATDIILNGWDGKHEIEKFYSVDENPHQVNPQEGIIATANYKPQIADYSHFDGYWQPGGRYFRILDKLSEKNKWTLEELKKIQLDNIVPMYSEFKEQFLKGLDKDVLDQQQRKALSYFKDWGGETSKDSVGSSIFHMWSFYIQKNIFVDEMGQNGFEKFGHTADYWHSFKKLLYNQNHSFWDNIKTDRVESGFDIITLSFRQACQELEKRLGARLSSWVWGRLHKALHQHPLGKNQLLGSLYNIGPIPADGGRYVINNMGHKKYTNNFTAVHGPATRRLIDMADPMHSYGILPTGNSGNPFSRYFQDQLKLYHQGEYRLQNMDWSSIRKNPLLKFRGH